jgi:periplasmic protein TonB
MKIHGWNDAVNPERLELVFANRNKEYGGYVLRKKYEKRVLMAFIATLAAILLAVVVPKLITMLSEAVNNAKQAMTEELVMAEPPPIDKSTPPPPPVIPPPPVQQTIKFTPPKVVKDEEVQEPPPTQEEVKETQVSTVTQEGSKDIIDVPTEVGDPDEGKIFTVVEEMPGFPGGEEELFKYLRKNIKYPPVARENGMQGRVFVTFVVDKDGKVKEALRVIRAMPDWKAGKQNGRAVSVQYNLPVNFTLK